MPVDTLTDARDIILSHVKTLWEAQSNPPSLLWQDKEDDEPDAATSWAVATVTWGPNRGQTLGETGNRLFRRMAVVQLEIRTPIGDGDVLADTYGETAMRMFEGNKAGVGEKVWFRNPAADGPRRDGAWMLTTVIATAIFDRQG